MGRRHLGAATGLSVDGGGIVNDADAMRRLVDAWGDPARRPAWLSALRDDKAGIAEATGGVAFVVDVALEGGVMWRGGVLSDGHVACPMDARGPADARIAGTPSALIGFMLGDQSLWAAIEDGLLVVPSGSTP